MSDVDAILDEAVEMLASGPHFERAVRLHSFNGVLAWNNPVRDGELRLIKEGDGVSYIYDPTHRDAKQIVDVMVSQLAEGRAF